MWHKNIAGRFFGLVTKHACDRRTKLVLPRPRWYSCVVGQKPFPLLGLGAEYRCPRWMWSTLRQPSEVSLTLTGELSWQRLRRSAVPGIWLCPPKFNWFTWLNYALPIHGLAIATDSLPTKFEVISTHYEAMTDDTKCRKWGGLG